MKSHHLRFTRRAALGLSLLTALSAPAAATERGVASWYGGRHHGRLMANGERFHQWQPTVAHRSLPLGTEIRIRNLANGRTARATVTDRGPYKPGRTLDVSRGLARTLQMEQDGLSPVEITVIRRGRKLPG